MSAACSVSVQAECISAEGSAVAVLARVREGKGGRLRGRVKTENGANGTSMEQ